MNIFELFLIAIGLSMDAFAVAICNGLTLKKVTIKNSLIIGLYFGIFQALMPLIGYIVGSQFSDMIVNIDHWIAFILLGIIGGKMIMDSLEKDCSENEEETSLKFSKMLPLAIATSIDALAVGVSFAFLKVEIISSISLIGITTLVISMIGVKIGNVFGTKFKSKAEFVGGVILVLIGLKILLEHTGIL